MLIINLLLPSPTPQHLQFQTWIHLNLFQVSDLSNQMSDVTGLLRELVAEKYSKAAYEGSHV